MLSCFQLAGYLDASERVGLGDAGYQLTTSVLTPYQRTQTEPQRRYQRCHIRTRVGVERSIGQLKNFGRSCLNKMTYVPEKCSNMIMVVVCLFNLKKMSQLPDVRDVPPSRLPARNNQTPAQYRNTIANTFFS